VCIDENLRVLRLLRLDGRKAELAPCAWRARCSTHVSGGVGRPDIATLQPGYQPTAGKGSRNCQKDSRRGRAIEPPDAEAEASRQPKLIGQSRALYQTRRLPEGLHDSP
jgi:hypothetical protein